MAFPIHRMRRLRNNPSLRRMVEETVLRRDDLIQPLFVCPGKDVARPIPSMPGVHQLSVDRLVRECAQVFESGVPAVILFGIPERKDPRGTGAYDADGIVQRAVAALKRDVPDLYVIGDVCLCEYTDHGHCGIVEDQVLRNDPTLELLAAQAVSLAGAGIDMVAPSAMADGQVAAIRKALDGAGFAEIPILSYAAKFASAFYAPFREAAESAPAFGDRRSYQMPQPNAREALREVALDVEEGADIVMVKPALAYLDIIRAVRDRFDVPVAAYNVSGEYSLVKAAAGNGWIDEIAVVGEILTGIKRAGADMILTYFARDVAGRLGRIMG